MNITVIGAGAMGSLFGALLAEAGNRVTLLDIRRDHVETVKANGLYIEKTGVQRIVRIQATTEFKNLCPASAVCMVKHLGVD